MRELGKDISGFVGFAKGQSIRHCCLTFFADTNVANLRSLVSNPQQRCIRGQQIACGFFAGYSEFWLLTPEF